MRRSLLAVAITLGVVVALGAVALASGRAPWTPGPSGGPGHTVAAPIDKIDVVIRESNPPQVSAKVAAGLPNGCAKQHSHQLTRAGDTITISVLNLLPDGDPICTAIYGTYLLTIDLGTDFAPGGSYTLKVNDKTTTFRT